MLDNAPQTVAEQSPGAPGPDRRRVILAAAGLSVAGVAGLAACGSDSSGSGTATSEPAAAPAGSAASGAAAGGAALAKLADVPVGGSYAAPGTDGKPIVIAQPEAGKVVAFSAACTHQGCKVEPAGKILNCPCHASTFDAFTGKNLSGPAPSPLPAVAVKISGTDIVAG